MMYELDNNIGDVVAYEKDDGELVLAKVARIKIVNESDFLYGLVLFKRGNVGGSLDSKIFYVTNSQIHSMSKILFKGKDV